MSLESNLVSTEILTYGPNAWKNADSNQSMGLLVTDVTALAQAVDDINSGTVTLTEVVVDAGTAAAPSITTNGDQNNGIYFPAADQVGISNAGVGQVIFKDGAIEPVTDNDIDLGSASKEFKNVYAQGTIISSNTTASTTKDTGAIVTEGGLGVELAIFAGTTINAGTNMTANGTITNTSSSAAALAVGLAGATNPAFVVDSSTGSQAAGLKVTGATAAGTVAAAVVSSGADANLSIDAKGTGTLTLQGTATGNIVVGDDIVPDADNTLDIGNLANNHRDIHASRAFINKGVASTEGYGQLALKYKSASKAMAGGATEVIPVQVPSGAILVAALLRNDTAIVGAGAATYSAAYSTGATQAISSGTAFTKNTKVTTPFTVQGAGEATNITSAATDITLTPNAGTLDTATVTAVVYYYELTALTDAA